MSERPEQLQMNFAAANTVKLRDYLDNGIFVTLFEVPPPPPELSRVRAAERLAELEHTVLNLPDLPGALAFTDDLRGAGRMRSWEYAALLPEAHRNRHVVYLSGRDTTAQTMQGWIGACRSAGLANLVPVSGDHVAGESAGATRQRHFTESVAALHSIAARADAKEFFPGGVANPYLYTAPAILAEYFKVVKKLNMGAQFIVAQAGFDLAQFQSLRWFLAMRNLEYPLLARLLLLTPERVERIRAGAMPGVTLSADFRRILDRELQFSPGQFEAAQYRRLELQAAGCKLLGASGIQLAGLDSPARVKIAAARIAQALTEFTSFEHWLEEYKFYLARSEMAPAEKQFYLFERLLRQAAPGEHPAFNDYVVPVAGAWELWREQAARFLFPEADRQPAGERRLLKKLLTGCRSCKSCRLPLTQFVCTERCPKRLANGPCGGVRPDGGCELGGGECIHIAVYRRADRYGQCEALETGYVPEG